MFQGSLFGVPRRHTRSYLSGLGIFLHVLYSLFERWCEPHSSYFSSRNCSRVHSLPHLNTVRGGKAGRPNQPSWCSRKSLHYHGTWVFKRDALCSNERLKIQMGAPNASQQAFKSLPVIQSSIARPGSVCCRLAEMPHRRTGSLAWHQRSWAWSGPCVMEVGSQHPPRCREPCPPGDPHHSSLRWASYADSVTPGGQRPGLLEWTDEGVTLQCAHQVSREASPP